MIKNLLDIKRLLEKAQITFWLDCGSLLHAYRDKHLPQDDIDFCLLMEEYPKVKKLIEENKELFDKIHYRYREISVHYKGIKTDFIFCEIKNKKLYMYSYKQNPLDHQKWNWEWRASYDESVYFPLTTMEFAGEVFNVPNNIEKKLALHYGEDWRTPKNVPCWTFDLNPIKDMSYNPIAVVMTTFLRDESLMKVLPSYLKYPVKLYLLDQGNHTPEKDKYYEELKKQGHYIAYSDFDIGLSKARNTLLDLVEEEFVLMTEDDIELQTNPYSFLQKFDNNNVGIMGGLLIRKPANTEQHYEYELQLENGVLSYIKSNNLNLVLNFFLGRKALFNEVRYDDNLKLAEHTDFALQLKKNGNWSVIYAREFLGHHYSERPTVYQTYRTRAVAYSKQMEMKWGIKKVIKDNIVKNIEPAIQEPMTETFSPKEDLTVFVITCGTNKNFEKCIEALKKQTKAFKLDIIKDFHPMGVAFQQMLERCTTPYYLQVDDDMILAPDAVEKMYNSVKETTDQQSMVCFKLQDAHLNKPIEGVKIYKRSIFKNFPYNTQTLACEMEQVRRMEKAGYSIVRKPEVIGVHCPYWTEQAIFERYYNWVDKQKKNNSLNYRALISQLYQIYIKNPSSLNFYALLGGLSSIMSKEIRAGEKDFTKYPTPEFSLMQEIFKEVIETRSAETCLTQPEIPKKHLILHISGSPCANRPYATAKLINEHSEKYYARHILGAQYQSNHTDVPYREFPVDLMWSKNRQECVKLIKEASIIHIHHNVHGDILATIPHTTPIVWTVSNLSQSKQWNPCRFNDDYEAKIRTWAKVITVTNQPLQKKVYEYLTLQTVPLVKCFFEEDTTKNNPVPVIVFAPTNRRPLEEKVTTKGYSEVLKIIQELEQEGLKFEFKLVEGVPYLKNIELKKSADIIIDDVISENFHNTSIEGACFGSVILTNYSDENFPFLKTSLDNLKETLRDLLTNPDKLKTEQQRIVKWKSRNYTPQRLLQQIEPIYNHLLGVQEVEKFMTEDDLRMKKFMTECLEAGEFWVLKETCLRVVNGKPISPQEVFWMGIKTPADKQKFADIAQKHHIPIKIVFNNSQATKLRPIYGLHIAVPFPVVQYLDNLYGKNWSKK